MRIEVAQSTCEFHTFGVGCDRCVCCNADVNEAGNRRYDSSIHWAFAQLSTGNFALYNERGQTVLITDDWNDVLAFYQARPIYTPRPRAPRANGPRSGGKISASDKAANTAALLAKLKGASK